MRNFDSSVAYVIYASDDRFAEILGVSLVSLYENSRDMKDIIVYILDSGITDENRKKILSVCRKYQRHPVLFIPVKNIGERLPQTVSVDRGSLSQYARIFIASELPIDIQRVLYLDCDTIVHQSIYELWNLNLQEKIIGALMDAFSRQYRLNIELEPDDVMFNSGVMLIDLDRWRKQKIEEKLLHFIMRKKGKIQQGDQGVLNAVLSRDTYCFEPKFNSVTIFYDFTYNEMLIYRKPPKFYTEEQVREAIEEPVVIHFTTSFLSRRPWMSGCNHKYVSEWLRYKSMSPWKYVPLWKDTRQRWKQRIARGYHMIPRRLAVWSAGMIQAYGRPFVCRISLIMFTLGRICR